MRGMSRLPVFHHGPLHTASFSTNLSATFARPRLANRSTGGAWMPFPSMLPALPMPAATAAESPFVERHRLDCEKFSRLRGWVRNPKAADNAAGPRPPCNRNCENPPGFRPDSRHCAGCHKGCRSRADRGAYKAARARCADKNGNRFAAERHAHRLAL